MTRTFTVKLGKSPDEMTFDECMAHIKRVLFWDYIDGEWCDVEILNGIRWEELAGYIRGAHEREVDTLKAENAKLREELAKWERLTDGIDLPEYPVTQFVPKDLERENAKLREVAERAWKSAERLCQAFDGPCRDDGVTIAKPCPMGERDEECVYGQLQRELRECGVEVDG